MVDFQENIMLIAPAFDTRIVHLGGGVYVATPWTMDDRKTHNFIGGVISFHDSKSEKSYLRGRIIEVVSLGAEEFARNRVAFIFQAENGSVNPARVRHLYHNTLTESHEQIRY